MSTISLLQQSYASQQAIGQQAIAALTSASSDCFQNATPAVGSTAASATSAGGLSGSTTGSLSTQTLQTLLGLTQSDPTDSSDPTQQSATTAQSAAPPHHHHHHAEMSQPPANSTTNSNTASNTNMLSAIDSDTDTEEGASSTGSTGTSLAALLGA